MKKQIVENHFSELRGYFQSLLCVPSLHGINPDMLCRKCKNQHLSVPLVGTLILEMVQVSVQLHQLPVSQTNLAASRPLGFTGPILYNVLADWVPFSKNTQTAHTPGSRGPHPERPGLERHRGV